MMARLWRIAVSAPTASIMARRRCVKAGSGACVPHCRMPSTTFGKFACIAAMVFSRFAAPSAVSGRAEVDTSAAPASGRTGCASICRAT
jgi:hypothetical protein